jgi:hypothetical protein
MPRNDPQHRRVWPWVLVILSGLLTTTGGSGGYETLGSLIIAGAAVMIAAAVRRNRAVRRTLLAAAQAQAARPGKKQGTTGRPRKSGAGRRAVRKAITLLP